MRTLFGACVAVYAVGYYAIDGKTNVPCLIYATSENFIKIYYDIRIDTIGLGSLVAPPPTTTTTGDAADDELQGLLKLFNAQGRFVGGWCSTSRTPSIYIYLNLRCKHLIFFFAKLRSYMCKM